MKRNALEWLILVVSILAVLGLVGYLVADGLGDSGTPVSITAEVVTQEGAAGAQGWLVPVRVRNVGGYAAIGVVVEGTAEVAGAVETSDLTVDVLAAGSEVGLMFGFSGRPEGDVQVRVVGYETP